MRVILSICQQLENALQARNAHARLVDQIAGGFPVEKRRVDGCARIGSRDVREDAFGAAALVEVIVDERDPRAAGQLPGDAWRGRTSATMYRCR